MTHSKLNFGNAEHYNDI